MAWIAVWSHQIELAAEPTSVAMARAFVCQHLLAHNLGHLVDDVRLVVSELASNAVAHAQTPFSLTLSSLGGSVLVTIEDQSAATPVLRAPGVMDMSGRGLMIVAALSDQWGARTDGNASKSVWASFLEDA